MVIFKYPIVNTELQTVDLPAGAKILSVQEQSGQLCLWALVNQSHVSYMRHIRIEHTGSEFGQTNSLAHIGTLLTAGGDYVLHVFEEHR